MDAFRRRPRPLLPVLASVTTLHSPVPHFSTEGYSNAINCQHQPRILHEVCSLQFSLRGSRPCDTHPRSEARKNEGGGAWPPGLCVTRKRRVQVLPLYAYELVSIISETCWYARFIRRQIPWRVLSNVYGVEGAGSEYTPGVVLLFERRSVTNVCATLHYFSWSMLTSNTAPS